MPHILSIDFCQLAHRMRLRVKTIHVVGPVLLRRLCSLKKNPTILVSGVNFFENMVLLEGDQVFISLKERFY